MGDRPSFLRALIKAVLAAHSHSGRKVVVVSPSYSGAFSIPLLISDPDLFCGFVPVAPGSASSFQVGTVGAVSACAYRTVRHVLVIMYSVLC